MRNNDLWRLNNILRKIIAFTAMVILISTSILFSGCITNNDSNNIKNIFLDEEKIINALDSAENWLISDLNEEGYFNYLYDPTSEEYSTSNNMIRQLMASRLLAEMCQENSSLEPLHQKNLEYVMEYWYREENETGYILYDNKSKLGAMAMALRALVYSPFFDEYNQTAVKLANTILSLQNDNGSFEPWFIAPDYSYDKDYLLTFYSGEAILSLVEMYLKTNNSVYLDAAITSQEFYIDKYVVHLEDNYYPAYVPWHTQSLNKLYKITGDQNYTDAVLTLNDKLLEIQDIDGPLDYLGRFYNDSTPQYGSPHSSSDAVYTEGLAYAYEIVVLTNDTEHQERYQDAILLGTYNLINLQFNDSNADDFQHIERIDGAVRVNIDDNRIRIDTTQHTVDAFRKILNIFDSDIFDEWAYEYDLNTEELTE